MTHGARWAKCSRVCGGRQRALDGHGAGDVHWLRSCRAASAARGPTFLGSSTVEQAAVNRKVTGSNPVRGAGSSRNVPRPHVGLPPGFFVCALWMPLGPQASATPPSQSPAPQTTARRATGRVASTGASASSALSPASADRRRLRADRASPAARRCRAGSSLPPSRRSVPRHAPPHHAASASPSQHAAARPPLPPARWR